MAMKTILNAGLAGALTCISFVSVSCDVDNDNHPAPVSYVSFYNASPNAPSLGILVDDKLVNTVPFAYSDHTSLRFDIGSRNFKIGSYGTSDIFVDTTLVLQEDISYSIFIVDEYDDASVLILTDKAVLPPPLKAKIRFINLSPDGKRMQLKVQDLPTPLIGGQSFKEASSYIDVDSRTYNLEVVSEEGTAISLPMPDIKIEDGWIYTILVRGYTIPPPGNKNGLSAEVVAN
jgi:hypothetical protein